MAESSGAAATVTQNAGCQRAARESVMSAVVSVRVKTISHCMNESGMVSLGPQKETLYSC